MTKLSCSQIALVEALYDGRLGPAEAASVERHVAGCEACSASAADLERIRELVRAPIDPATPLEHQRARQTLLRRAASSSRTPGEESAESTQRFRRRRPLVTMLAAAAMLALAMVVGFGIARVSSDPARPATAMHMPHPRRIETTVQPSEGARFERARTAELDAVKLVSGTLDVTVRAVQSERFVITTEDAEIKGRGTTFQVEADRGKIRAIKVETGSVEVSYGGFTAVITSGGSWRANPEAKVGMAEPAPAATQTAAPPQQAPVVVAQRAPGRAEPRRRVETKAPVAAPESVAHESKAPAAKGPEAASREFADAMGALGRGDYDSGVARLEAFASAHPKDARSDDAEYVRAVALQRTGKTAEAAMAAKRYLDARPDGAHRAEATKIIEAMASK